MAAMIQKVLLAAMLMLASPTSAQILRGGVHTWTSMSSSSWSRGEDGKMHEQVERTRSETIHDHGGSKVYEKNVHCANGLCEESSSKITKAAENTVEHPTSMNGHDIMTHRMPTSLKSLLSHILPSRFPIVEIQSHTVPRVEAFPIPEVHEVHCENGHCEQTQALKSAPAVMPPDVSLMPFGLPTRMQGLLKSVMSTFKDFEEAPVPKVEVLQGQDPDPLFEFFFGSQLRMGAHSGQQPIEVQIIPVKAMEPTFLNLRGSNLPQLQEPKASQDGHLVEGVKIKAMDDVALAATAALFSAFTVIIATMVIAFRHFKGKKLCAREPTIREALGEPLAPETVDPIVVTTTLPTSVARQAVAPAQESANWAELDKEKAKTVAGIYLQELYAKTLEEINVPGPRPLCL